MSALALFDVDSYDQEPDIINPRAVACPTCGALVARPCKRLPGHPMVAHQARIAQARHVAGVVDEPAPRLL